jgi:hypothetical protein
LRHKFLRIPTILVRVGLVFLEQGGLTREIVGIGYDDKISIIK